MRNYITIFFLALCSIFFSACEENITLDLPEYETKLAVHCILHPGEAPELYLSRSKSYFDYSDTSHETEYISDAQVIITDVSAGINDTLAFKRINNNFHYAGKLDIKAGQKYILNVWYKGKHVTAETIVPKPVEITEIENGLAATDAGGGFRYFDGKVKVKYYDQPGEGNAYILSVSEFDTTFYHNVDNIYNYDRNSDGKQMQNEFQGGYYDDGRMDSMVVYIKIENHTLETAQYMESVEEQNWTRSDPTVEPVFIKHNITGGLGIFGASTAGKRARLKVW